LASHIAAHPPTRHNFAARGKTVEQAATHARLARRGIDALETHRFGTKKTFQVFATRKVLLLYIMEL
jgi:hypothetical protein